MNQRHDDSRVHYRLRRLFNAAAAMSMAVINQDDAEPEMARFLHLVESHPDQRPFVAQLFIESFGDSSCMNREPWEFLQFCAHRLRWSELREFIAAKWAEDVARCGARSWAGWNDVLAAFEDDWAGASQFREFRREDSEIVSALGRPA